MWHIPDSFYMDSKYLESLDKREMNELEINKSKLRVKIADKQK